MIITDAVELCEHLKTKLQIKQSENLAMYKRDSLHTYAFSKREPTWEIWTSRKSHYEWHFQLLRDPDKGKASLHVIEYLK